jgi:hypothetical protein
LDGCDRHGLMSLCKHSIFVCFQSFLGVCHPESFGRCFDSTDGGEVRDDCQPTSQGEDGAGSCPFRELWWRGGVLFRAPGNEVLPPGTSYTHEQRYWELYWKGVSKEKLLQATEGGGLTPSYNGGREECSLNIPVNCTCLQSMSCRRYL